jgi:DNA replication protein DnaC
MSKARPIAEILPFMSALPKRSEEEWAARDKQIEEERVRLMIADEQRKAAERRDRFVKAGFTTRALDIGERADEGNKAIVKLSTWPTAEKTILILSGSAGCGKTVAATWWALRQPTVPLFVRASSFAATSRFNRDVRDEWLNAKALILDDLGTEYADTKGNFLVDLDELIDTFYGHRRALLITTNCPKGDFKNRYGERITDRIRECGEFHALSGSSLRSKRS